MGQNTASDPDAVLAEYQARRNEAQKLFKSGEVEAASTEWIDVSVDIVELRDSSSSTVLITKGGSAFVDSLPGTYSWCTLNYLHVNVRKVEDNRQLCLMVGGFVMQANKTFEEGYWMPGYQWKPADVHKAKFHYQSAMFYGLGGIGLNSPRASWEIDQAEELLPHDSNIQKELKLCNAWLEEARRIETERIVRNAMAR